MAVGNNTDLPIKRHCIVVVGLVFTEELLVTSLWCKDLSVMEDFLKIFRYKSADEEKCTYVVHLLLVGVCQLLTMCTTTVTVISDEVILRVDPGTAGILKFMT